MSDDGYSLEPPAMSYDFLLFPHGGEVPLEASLDRSVGHGPDGAAAPDASQARVVERLRAVKPPLRGFDRPDDGPHQRHFAAPEAGGAAQVHLGATSAAVQVPLWNAEEPARFALVNAWAFLRIVTEETGWVVYDEQAKRLVDLDADFDQVLAAFVAEGIRLDQVMRELGVVSEAKPPWWKIW